mgnify:CR=1 FL=1
MSLPPVPAGPAEAIELDLFLEALHRRWHYDFRSYSRASLVRRVELARERLGCATLSDLQGRVLRDETVLPDVLDAMTVQVSELFRDPDYFLSLRRNVVPHLRTFPSLKVWVAGCADGEELYSLAILLREEGLLDRLGGGAWQARKARLKERIKLIADKLMRVAAERLLRAAPVLEPEDHDWQAFAARFPYSETEDQLSAIDDVTEDLAAGRPMDRLIVGDVGFGKTEVAVRAAAAAALSVRAHLVRAGDRAAPAVVAPAAVARGVPGTRARPRRAAPVAQGAHRTRAHAVVPACRMAAQPHAPDHPDRICAVDHGELRQLHRRRGAPGGARGRPHLLGLRADPDERARGRASRAAARRRRRDAERDVGARVLLLARQAAAPV